MNYNLPASERKPAYCISTEQWDKRWRNLSRSLVAAAHSIEEAMERTGKSFEQLQLANQRSHWIAIERILKFIKETGITSAHEIAKLIRCCRKTVAAAKKFTLEFATLQVGGSFLSTCNKQGANREGGDVLAGGSEHRDSIFASLSTQPKAEHVAVAAGTMLSTVEQSGTATNKTGYAERSPNILRVNTDTGEVELMHEKYDGYTVWTPSHRNDRPPGSPYRTQGKRSEKQTEPSYKPPQLPAPVPIDTTMPPQPRVPCPPELREQIYGQLDKFAMDKQLRDAKYKRLAHDKAKTNLERVELADSANDEWWHKNKSNVRALFGEHK